MVSERLEREAEELWNGVYGDRDRPGLELCLLTNGYLEHGMSVDMRDLLKGHIAAALERIVRECADAAQHKVNEAWGWTYPIKSAVLSAFGMEERDG